MPSSQPPAAATACFLWVRGLRGPTPQKWSGREIGRGRDVLASRDIPEELAHLSLRQLTALFPPPADDGS